MKQRAEELINHVVNRDMVQSMHTSQQSILLLLALVGVDARRVSDRRLVGHAPSAATTLVLAVLLVLILHLFFLFVLLVLQCFT
jgi:Protein of unknown function (DUF3309)